MQQLYKYLFLNNAYKVLAFRFFWGVPAIIYTNAFYWNLTTGNSKEIYQSIPLWDADLKTDQLADFTAYGPWTRRLGLQYTGTSPLKVENYNAVSVDYDVFDPSLFNLPKPPVGCKPALIVSNLTVTRVGSAIRLKGTISDGTAGTTPAVCDALATRINQATLVLPSQQNVSSVYTAASPLKLNTITALKSAAFSLDFHAPVAVAAGTHVTIKLSYSCGGFKSTLVSFPNLVVQ